MLHKALLALAFLLAAGAALASQDADHTYKYAVTKEKSPGDMILQVYPPAGFDRVVVKKGEEVQKTTTLPAYFKFKNESDQVVVTIIGGKSAYVDIALPLFRDTFHELRVSAEAVPGRPAAAAPAAAPPATAARYIGRVRNCREEPRRFSFLRNDVEVGNVTVSGQQRKDFQVPAGEYAIRIFTVGGEEKLVRVERNFRVAGDEWAFNYYCSEAAAAAAAKPQPRTGTLSGCAPYLDVLVTFLQNGNPAKKVTVGTGQSAEVALMPGDYMVRRQAAARPQERALWNDAPLTVPNQDGWKLRCGT